VTEADEAPPSPPMSRRSLERQINREGRRWGLVADDGKEEKRLMAEAILWFEDKLREAGAPEIIDEEMAMAALEEANDNDPFVGVCRLGYRAEAKHGVGEIVRGDLVRLCSLDDNASFSAVLQNRATNGETDMAAPYRRARDDEKRKHAKWVDEQKKAARATWRSRRSIIALPSGIIPAGLRERARRLMRGGR
jgi:hypothetical protein